MERRKLCLYLVCLHFLAFSSLANCENIHIATSSAKNALSINNNNTVLNTTLPLSQILNTTGSNGNVHKNRNIKPTAIETIPNESGTAVEINVGKIESMVQDSKPITVTAEPVSNTSNITINDKSTFVHNDNGTHVVNSLNTTDSRNITNPTDKTNPANVIPTTKVHGAAEVLNKTEEVKSTTTSTTTTTTTTTTPKPKKPSITFGLADFPVLPGETNILNKVSESASSKLPVPNDSVAPPNAEPSQELNTGFNYRSGRDYIVPVMTVLFTVPLAIGVVITTYRRFRDCWSTRHYRRMDFLVDGMYND